MKTSKVIRSVLDFFNLESELEDNDSVYIEISKGISFKGTNLWILIFAIIVASVGLNINSTAVIIGAMLISPLMGPINGIGYSIATYDNGLFKKSVKNFSFAIIASLLTSTLFFAVSPLSTAHSELLARTSPTIYDVLIALFGGMAGIVAICSKKKGNVIPGVAIATALMPPLCTAGYGLASGKFDFFFGAMYLFTINTIFIAMASAWISQLMKFPIRSQIDEKKKKKINQTISLLITLVLLPSIYFGYNLIKQEEFMQRANNYVSNVSQIEGNYLLNHSIDVKSKRIVLVYGGTTLLDDQKEVIIQKSIDFDIPNAIIIIQQGLAFTNDNATKEKYALNEQVLQLKASLEEKCAFIDSIQSQQEFGEILLCELKTIYPQVQGCSYAESLIYHDTLTVPLKQSILFLTVGSQLATSDKDKIRNWLIKRLKKEEVKLVFERTTSKKR